MNSCSIFLSVSALFNLLFVNYKCTDSRSSMKHSVFNMNNNYMVHYKVFKTSDRVES